MGKGSKKKILRVSLHRGAAKTIYILFLRHSDLRCYHKGGGRVPLGKLAGKTATLPIGCGWTTDPERPRVDIELSFFKCTQY